jgi:hypothetical protein
VGRFAHLRRPDAFDAYLRRDRREPVSHQVPASAGRNENGSAIRTGGSRSSAGRNDPDVRDQIWRAVERLPWRQRAAVALRYYEYLSLAQIWSPLTTAYPDTGRIGEGVLCGGFGSCWRAWPYFSSGSRSSGRGGDGAAGRDRAGTTKRRPGRHCGSRTIGISATAGVNPP